MRREARAPDGETYSGSRDVTKRRRDPHIPSIAAFANRAQRKAPHEFRAIPESEPTHGDPVAVDLVLAAPLGVQVPWTKTPQLLPAAALR